MQIQFKTIALLFVMFSSVSQARVSDFHSMISENLEAQKELHSNLKKNIKKDTALAAAADGSAAEVSKEKIVVMDPKSPAYNVPTKKSLLTVQKEKEFYRGTTMKKKLEKVANEVKESERAF